jgi:UDP-N-acetyl-D-glucosamine dehydrogenase
MNKAFSAKVDKRESVVGIIGLGYVGLPLIIEFAKKGFPVLGFDVDQTKIDALQAGTSYIRHIEAKHIQDAFIDGSGGKKADATVDFSRIAECDAILICVPTPLTEHRDPDLSYIEATARSIGPHLQKGQLIVLESTTYPGTSEDVLIPILQDESGLHAGADFMVAYSPEREDPNNKEFSTSTIPKVVGGYTLDSLDAARSLYDCVISETVPVSSCRAAEATKLMENIFRSVNIALVNELKTVFTEMDIDVWEVIRAASTKPFGFMPFYPGPGLGGHCIPIDPFYLTWKAREYGATTRFIELAGEINTGMPKYVIQRTMLALNDQGKAIKGSKIVLIGLAYKKNVDDDRESPTYALWDELKQLGADVSYFDPYCPEIRPSREHSHLAGIRSLHESDVADGTYDAAIISTAHDGVDHDALAKHFALLVDTRGVCAPAENIVKA